MDVPLQTDIHRYITLAGTDKVQESTRDGH